MKKHLILLLLLGIVCACNELNDEQFLEDAQEIERFDSQLNYDTNVTLQDVKLLVQHETSRRAKSRKTSKTDFNNYTVEQMKGDGEARIFIVNYPDNAGFMLESSTKKYEPILAWNDQGHFDRAKMPEPTKMWMEYILLDMHKTSHNMPQDSISKYLSKWQYNQSVVKPVKKSPKRKSLNDDYDYDQVFHDSIPTRTSFRPSGSPICENYQNSAYLYMDWGWGRDCNGFYTTPFSGSMGHSFTDMKMIIITNPNS